MGDDPRAETTEMKDRISHLRKLLWTLCIIGLAGIVVLKIWTWMELWPRQETELNQRALEGLGNFGTVPEFSLIERSGDLTGLSALRRKIWIADFIYTNCPDTCPLQSAEMARLQTELSDIPNVRLVSVTVDPKRDTPQALSRYAERFNADRRRWLFLTGEKEEIYRLAQQGFRLSAVPVSKDEGNDDPAFIHSSRFVLVDGKATIRGYYDSNDVQALQHLRRDIKTLLGEDRS